MDISEEVLFSTLAQLVQKDLHDVGKKQKNDQKAFEIVKNITTAEAASVDVQYELERKIIEILLLYGTAEEEFEDVLLKVGETGDSLEIKEINRYKVYQRIYLSLQEDEVELANPLFRSIYNDLINYFHQHETFELEQYLMRLDPSLAQEVTNILMEEEREVLHNWESKQIVVKQKNQTISQYVSETILTLRWFLVDKIIGELKNSISNEPEADNSEILATAVDYYTLINSFSSKLGRVLSRYS
jgi:DNA primase